MLSLHFSIFLFALSGLLAKWSTLPAEVLVWGRCAVAAAAVALFQVLGGRKSETKAPPSRAWLLLCGAILAAHWYAFFLSLQLGPAAIGFLVYATYPAFTAVIDLFRGRKSAAREVSCMLSMVLGVCLLLPSENNVASVSAIAWGSISAFLFAVLTHANKSLGSKISSLDVAKWETLGAALCFSPFALPSAWPLAWSDLFVLLFLGVVCTGVAHTLFIRALDKASAVTASIISCLEPVYGIAAALVLFDEVPSTRTVLGGALILGSAVYLSCHHSSHG